MTATACRSGLSLARLLHRSVVPLMEQPMPSRNVGSKRQNTNDPEIPAELSKREAQDRPQGKDGENQARSPVDAMHVDAPALQDNKRGHRQKKRS
jgi:hypothetical protein